jgi:hypothetical protein
MIFMSALLSESGKSQERDTVRALYFLVCLDCMTVFSPVVSTSERDLLVPDWEVMAEQAGPRNAERFQDFFSEHRSHRPDCRAA